MRPRSARVHVRVDVRVRVRVLVDVLVFVLVLVLGSMHVPGRAGGSLEPVLATRLLRKASANAPTARRIEAPPVAHASCDAQLAPLGRFIGGYRLVSSHPATKTR
jgi:hypothetical protein